MLEQREIKVAEVKLANLPDKLKRVKFLLSKINVSRVCSIQRILDNFTAEFLGVLKPSFQTLIYAVTDVCGRPAYFMRNRLVCQAK